VNWQILCKLTAGERVDWSKCLAGGAGKLDMEGTMRTLESRPRQDRQVSCVACARHMHPEMVPWLQHTIGCPVRTAALARYPEARTSRGVQPLAVSAAAR
jgi:hypothetical protein